MATGPRRRLTRSGLCWIWVQPLSTWPALNRNGASDPRAARAGAFDFEAGADEAGAIVHNAQPHARGAAFEVREWQAVILNGQDDLIGAIGQADADALGFAMLDGIGHGFLG